MQSYIPPGDKTQLEWAVCRVIFRQGICQQWSHCMTPEPHLKRGIIMVRTYLNLIQWNLRTGGHDIRIQCFGQ